MCDYEIQQNIFNAADNSTLPPSTPNAYKRRWWIVFIYCSCVAAQVIFYNSFGPITESTEGYFGWTDGMIGLLANWFCIAVICGMFPLSYLIQKKGNVYI
ncbi:hypothetical protein KUTeg_015508 [Tegillarca granosa]|uniref:Uncharacterized protein n=1 Tax=Tegillarca granosa TaxID=220873 RepID=A0ABQ9EQX2_TEGGR|nr:hypothetical protein KUTeg_015508 [Tegillarca granosa]